VNLSVCLAKTRKQSASARLAKFLERMANPALVCEMLLLLLRDATDFIFSV
jgi:hypothetical protein